LKERRKKWKYGFDRVFNQNNGQRDVWEGAEPLVQSCIDGFHVCMFAYGQVSYFDRLCIHISIIYPVLTTMYSPVLDWIWEDTHNDW
jgi:regulator of replication initiation timing